MLRQITHSRWTVRRQRGLGATPVKETNMAGTAMPSGTGVSPVKETNMAGPAMLRNRLPASEAALDTAGCVVARGTGVSPVKETIMAGTAMPRGTGVSPVKETNMAGTAIPRGGGFTLLEAMAATILVGLGVAAIMVTTTSGTQVNAEARNMTRAMYLGQEIREWTLKLPFSDPDPEDQGNPPGPDGASPQIFVDDLDDLMDVTYSPPRDGRSLAISDLADWSQHISLTWLDPDNLTTTVTAGSSDMIYVEVTVLRDGQLMLTTSWLVARRQ